MKNKPFGGKVRAAFSSERAEAMPAAIITAIVSSLLLLGIATVVSLVVQNKSDSEGRVSLTTSASNIDVSLRSDITQASYLTASAKLKQPTTRLLSPTDVSLSGVNMHIPASNGNCKVVRWNISGTNASRELAIYQTTLKTDTVVKCNETSPVVAKRNKAFAQNVAVKAPFSFTNQVGRELAFTITEPSLDTVNAELDRQLKAKNVQKLSDADFNELNKLMGADSYVVGFRDPAACALNAAKVNNACPPAETETVTAAWNSQKIAKVAVDFQIQNSAGEVAKRNISQNSSVPLYANSAEAEAAVADSSADNRPMPPIVNVSTNRVILGTNYTINWTTGAVCPADTVRTFKLYENGSLIRTQPTAGFTKNYTNSATEFLNYNVQVECVRGALVVNSDMSAPATAKVIPAPAAVRIINQPAASNAPLNANLTADSACLYGTTPRYNLVQASSTYGAAGTTITGLTSVNRPINAGFTVVEGARYQYRVEATCYSAYDQSTVSTGNTALFTTIINTPAAPAFTAPAEGATNVATNITVTWSAVTCPVGTSTQYYSAKNVNGGAAITPTVMRNWTADLNFVSNNTQGNLVGYVLQARCNGTAVPSAPSAADTLTYTTLINTPAAATFSAPIQGATNVATNATVAWSSVTCPTATTTQYYMTKNMNAGVVLATPTVINNWTIDVSYATNNTQGNTVGYTVATRCAGPNASSASSVTNNVSYTTGINAPAAPAFTAPAEGAMNVATNATVTWSAVTCPAGTSVRYYTTKNLNAGVAITPVVLDNWTADLSYVSSNTQGNRVGYTVAARCQGPNTNSASSATSSLTYTTLIDTPAATTFTAPAEGATNVATNATVTWGAVTCPTATTTQYYTTKNINGGVTVTPTVIDNWSTNLSFISNNTQGNRVGYTVATRCAGPNANSASSATDSLTYTTLINNPAAPLFVSPAEGATNVATNATVTWSTVTCPTATTVKYYTTKNMNAGAVITPIVIDNWTVGNTLVSNNTQGNRVGYTVAARCDGPNAVSSGTATNSLTYTTVIAAPTGPLFTAPAEGATNVATNATVTWSGVTCASGTSTRYYSTKNMNAGAAITPAVIDNWTPDVSLVSNNTQGNRVGYTVAARCDGPNAVSASSATDTLTYTTIINVPAIPTFTAPTEGEMDVPTNVTVTWNAAVCGSSTTAQYYVTKNMNLGLATPPAVLKNWGTGASVSTSNTEGNRVGYTLSARCVGPNATSAGSGTAALTYTTIMNAPSMPTFSSPSQNATGVATNTLVTWTSVTCASGGTVEYYATKNMDAGVAITPIVVRNWTSDVSLVSNNTQGNRVGYSVAARCVGPNATSAASSTDTVEYITAISAPATPAFTSPAEGATGISTSATVTWGAVTCATGTTPKYYTTKNVENGVAITPVVIDNWTTSTSLVSNNNQGSTVGYTVKALCEGPNYNSAQTIDDTLAYTTRILAPAMPTFISPSPADSATDVSTTATIAWSNPTCATGTTTRFYTTKDRNAGVAITPIVIDNWTTDNSYVTSNSQGHTVRYTVKARCYGPNATSTDSGTDYKQYTTLINNPSGPNTWNDAWGTVSWSAPTTGCAPATSIQYRIHQIRADNNVVDAWGGWGTGTSSGLPTYNSGGYPQWAQIQARCVGPNDSSSGVFGNTTKWVKRFSVSFNAWQAWRRINVTASCPFATTVGPFHLYVAADGWWGARGVYGGIYTDEGAWIADAQAGGGGNTGWLYMRQQQNTQWDDVVNNNTTHNWGYWGNAGWGSHYTPNYGGSTMSGTYWNASGWGSWAYWYTGRCESPYMHVYAKNGVWNGGGIRNAGDPGAHYNSWPANGYYYTQAGVDATQ